jgi:hypothetical protein
VAVVPTWTQLLSLGNIWRQPGTGSDEGSGLLGNECQQRVVWQAQAARPPAEQSMSIQVPRLAARCCNPGSQHLAGSYVPQGNSEH